MKLASLLFLLSVPFFSVASEGQTTIRFKFNGSANELRMNIQGKIIEVSPDNEGNAVVKTMISHPQYVKLMRTNLPELLYLFPGEEMEIAILGAANGQLAFKGPHAAINSWLTNPRSIQIGGGFDSGEAEYMALLKSKVDTTIAAMLRLKLDKGFTEKEKKRIAARIYTSLVTYPSMRKRRERTYIPSDTYYDFVTKVLFEDRDMLVLDEYTGFLQYLIQLRAVKDVRPYDPLVYAETTLRYVADNVKDTEIKKHLINFYAYDYLKRNGIENIEGVTKMFRRYVTDPADIKKYDETCNTWEKVAKGRKIGDYEFYDIKDSKVTFSSLRGSYLYIDTWATWCKPCLAELPHLRKLEDSLRGRNITFVSISVDKDQEAWKKMVTEDKFEGVQWHARERDFSRDLMIVSIPRFVLIDPDGKIVEVDMTRPSNSGTLKFLRALPGI